MTLRLLLSLLIVVMVATSAQAQDDIVLYSLSYSPDGDYVAGVGNRVVVWDGETGDIVANVPITLKSSIDSLVDADWSPAGHRLVVAGTDRRIRILDFSGDAHPLGGQLAEFELMTFLDVRSIGWSPDGSLIAVGGDGYSPKLEFWDASTYEFIRATPHNVGAYRIAWHPASARNLIAVTNGYSNGAKLVNTAEDAPRNDTMLCGDCAPDAVALPLAWNSDGSLLAIGHTNGEIFIVDADTNAIVMSMQGGEYASELVWTNEDQHLLSLSHAGVQVWDSVTGRLLNAPPFPKVSEIAAHPSKDQIFYFDNGSDIGDIVELSTLLEPTPLMTATFTPTQQK